MLSIPCTSTLEEGAGTVFSCDDDNTELVAEVAVLDAIIGVDVAADVTVSVSVEEVADTSLVDVPAVVSEVMLVDDAFDVSGVEAAAVVEATVDSSLVEVAGGVEVAATCASTMTGRARTRVATMKRSFIIPVRSATQVYHPLFGERAVDKSELVPLDGTAIPAT